MKIWNQTLFKFSLKFTNIWIIKFDFVFSTRFSTFLYVLTMSSSNFFSILFTSAWTFSCNRKTFQVSSSLHRTIRSIYMIFILIVRRASTNRSQMQSCNTSLLCRNLCQKRIRKLLLRHSRSFRQWIRLRSCRWCTSFYLIIFTKNWIMSSL